MSGLEIPGKVFKALGRWLIAGVVSCSTITVPVDEDGLLYSSLKTIGLLGLKCLH